MSRNEHGAKIMGQLNHSGTHPTSIRNMRETWAPSAIPCVQARATPKAMEIDDIKELICGYAQSARNPKAGGFDGAEIHGAHGCVPLQFLSPAFNKRTNEHGGSLENRLRFTYEVIDAIRSECGRDSVLGLRISGDQLIPGGLTLSDTKVIVQKLEETGKLDYISVSIANYNINGLFVPPMYIPMGFAVYSGAGIKEAVQSIPVFTIGRINDPLMAEKILADGHADVIGMTRANIADPELPNKAREGRLDDIRTCIACNEGCVGRLDQNSWVSCMQNPTAGREKELGMGTLKLAEARRKVLVVGGGPAGMEAARVAALVTVFNLCTNRETVIEDVDTVVLATGNEANNRLYRALKGRVRELYAIGDCLAPRKAMDAIFDGHRVGREV